MTESGLQPPHTSKEESQYIQEPLTEDKKQLFVSYLGEEALRFLEDQNVLLKLERAVSARQQLLFFYFEVHGRVVEFVYDEQWPKRLEVAYSFADDFYARKKNRFHRKGTLKQLPESVGFIRFLIAFFKKCKRDAPLLFYTFGEERVRLVELFIREAKLSNAKNM